MQRSLAGFFMPLRLKTVHKSREIFVENAIFALDSLSLCTFLVPCCSIGEQIADLWFKFYPGIASN